MTTTPPLLPDCCWSAHLDGRSRGYLEGVTAGRAQVLAELRADAIAAVRSAAKGTPRHPWKVTADPELLTAHAAASVAVEQARFRTAHAATRSRRGEGAA